jgi:hypothetical protein
MYNNARQNLGLVWVLTNTELIASSYRQYFYSRQVTAMLGKVHKGKSDVRCPRVNFNVLLTVHQYSETNMMHLLFN